MHVRDTPPTAASIVFDMDGTLFDSSSAVPDAYITTLHKRAGLTLSREDVIACYPLGPPINILRHFMGDAASNEDVRNYHAELDRQSAGLVPYTGIVDLFQDLHRRAVPCAVFTGADTASCLLLMRNCGLASFFPTERLLGTDLVAHPKPAPDGLLYTCAQLQMSPESVAYVGDSPLDQRAAFSAGCIPVSAGWGHLHDAQEPTLFIAHTPADVVQLLP